MVQAGGWGAVLKQDRRRVSNVLRGQELEEAAAHPLGHAARCPHTAPEGCQQQAARGPARLWFERAEWRAAVQPAVAVQHRPQPSGHGLDPHPASSQVAGPALGKERHPALRLLHPRERLHWLVPVRLVEQAVHVGRDRLRVGLQEDGGGCEGVVVVD